MARLNEILVGRFNKGLQRVFGIKGGPPVATLAPELMPVHVVPNGVETRYLENWNRFGFAKPLAGVAGQSLGWQVRNPANSNTIAVVESIFVSSEVACEFAVYSNNGGALTDLTSLGAWANFDGRIGNQIKGVILASFQSTTPAVFTFVYDVFTAVGIPLQLINTENQEIVLVPNSLLLVQAATQNVASHVSIAWRERFLEESERI